MGSYIHNLAMSLIGQLEITDADLGKFKAQSLYENASSRIKDWLSNKSNEMLGRIAGCGDADGGTKLYQVHCETWLSKRASGRALLFEIACTAIVAKMADILGGRREEPNTVPHVSEYQTPEDVPDRVMHRAGFY